MSSYIATIVDTTGIQPYIFSSNRLRENVGASYLVDMATSDWVEWALNQLGKGVYIPLQNIESGNTSAELVYSGGGNAVLLFNDIDYAKKFTNILSEKVLRNAPGLKFVVAHSEEFEWGYKLSRIINNLKNSELKRRKRDYNPSTPLMSLGVTASCNSTGLVAVDTSERYGIPKADSYLISKEIVEKLRAVDKAYGESANKKLRDTIFDSEKLGDYQIPYDVDDMGRLEGDTSYIAVVHADGNSMGACFKECGNGKSDREYIKAVRTLSEIVKQAGIKALKVVAEQLVVSANKDATDKFPITKRNGQKYLPFRPLVYGGDDVTFVCDGRLGLTLAALYLQEFQKEKDLNGNSLTACAGISIVKTHYPFARAYNLSASLCGNAKKFMREEVKRLDEPNFSALDWHIAASGLSGSLSEIRKREYQVPEGRLTMRPVRLQQSEQSDGEWRTWNDFAGVVRMFNTDPNWAGRRNKVIALREELRRGSEATRKFVSAYGLKHLPPLSKLDSELQQCGWTDVPKLNSGGERVCGYFDAIEAKEFYISLGE